MPHSVIRGEEPEEPEVDSAELADQELFEESGELESHEDDPALIRSELVLKVSRSLLADADRCDGQLERADIDRAYLRRSLSIAECLAVETSLVNEGVKILDLEADEPASENGSTGNRRRKKYLTHEEERAFGRAIQLASKLAAQGGSGNADHDDRVMRDADTARSRFVDANVRYIWKLVWEKGTRAHLMPEDLFQEGMIGLLRATDTYDPEKGFRFKTYATWWIEQRMHRALADGDRTVRLPVHLQDRYRRIRRSEIKLTLLTGREPPTEELADAVGMDPTKLEKLLWRIRATDCLEGDAPVGDGISIMEMIPDQRLASGYDIAEANQGKQLIASLLRTLSPREERVLRMRFGIDLPSDHTLQEVGDEFSVTRERIRQIEAKALRKLKHPTRSRHLKLLIQ